MWNSMSSNLIVFKALRLVKLALLSINENVGKTIIFSKQKEKKINWKVLADSMRNYNHVEC